MGLTLLQAIPSVKGPNWWKMLKKRVIKVEKLIFKRKKRGFIRQKIVFLKDLFKNKHYTISCKGSKQFLGTKYENNKWLKKNWS